MYYELKFKKEVNILRDAHSCKITSQCKKLQMHKQMGRYNFY